MLKERVITAVVLLVVLGLILFALPSVFFSIFVLLVVAVAGWEWSRLAGLVRAEHQIGYAAVMFLLVLLLKLLPGQSLLARLTSTAAIAFWGYALYLIIVSPEREKNNHSEYSENSLKAFDLPLLGCGAFVLVSTAFALMELRYRASEHSVWLLLYVLGLVWVMDIGAYFSGRRFGKTKLAPRVSPGKTREGVYGGFVFALCLVMVAMLVHAPFREHAFMFLLASLCAALVSVVGDLYESRLKRASGFKDSSQILPGHGGVLDRIDGVVAALPVFLGIWIWA